MKRAAAGILALGVFLLWSARAFAAGVLEQDGVFPANAPGQGGSARQEETAGTQETDAPQEADFSQEETDLLQQQLLEELDLEAADRALDELLGEDQVSLKSYVTSLIRGEIPLNLSELLSTAGEAAVLALTWQQETAFYILALAVASCAFAKFAGVVERTQVSEVSFYMMYFLLFTVLARVYQTLSQLAQDTVGQILDFMKILMPSYLVASVISSGSVSGAAFYELILAMISATQWLVRYAVIPATNLYMLCVLLNQMSREDFLSKLAELLKMLVEWALKLLTAAVIGLQAVQRLVLPAVDALKQTILQKAGSSIPGIGNLFNSVTEMFLGSAVLIKNAVGVAGLLILALICLVPVLRLGVCALLYRLMGAVLQPIADPRITECVSGVGEGALLMMKIVFTTGLLFFLSIAMAVASL